jgi:hypothetical protein
VSLVTLQITGNTLKEVEAVTTLHYSAFRRMGIVVLSGSNNDKRDVTKLK